ncbi:MAG: DUF4198 domain-containing protein [Marinagarivorans sp.]|nr:DUF4198 domain-containing protein [Marinagarivorans sp.]
MKNSFNRYLRAAVAVIVGVSISHLAFAHGRWIIPSHSILSGEQPAYVSVDMSISNDFFHPDIPYGGKPLMPLPPTKVDEKDHAAVVMAERLKRMQKVMDTTQLKVVFPNGQQKSDYAIVDLGRKSASAVYLDYAGTYRLELTQDPVLITLFENADGKAGREFGSPTEVKDLLPEGAKSIKFMRVSHRVNTYITLNDVTKTALKPEGKGLEIQFITHPNALFVGEKMRGQLLFNGKPVPEPITLHVTRNDTRYRNQRDEQKITIKADGKFEIPWKTAGLYVVEAEYTDKKPHPEIDLDNYALYSTFEVNPE